jgi:hypothetical protein
MQGFSNDIAKAAAPEVNTQILGQDNHIASVHLCLNLVVVNDRNKVDARVPLDGKCDFISDRITCRSSCDNQEATRNRYTELPPFC